MNNWAIADLHGNINLWKGFCQDVFKENDKIFFLGDSIDRGPDGFQLMKELLMDDRVIYLKGNHEDMFAKDMIDYIKYDGLMDYAHHLHMINGGEPTWNAWIDNGAKAGYINVLNKLPLTAKFKNEQGINIILCHAGYTPLENKFITEQDMIWSRDHLYDPWPEDYQNLVIIHGHTPIQYLYQAFEIDKKYSPKEDGSFWYSENHKIDIDCGSYSTNCAIALNLDTFDEEIIEI